MEHRARKCGRRLLPYPVFAFLTIALTVPNGASCSTAERRMQLFNVSPEGSPIGVSGYVTYRYDDSKAFPFSYQENISAKNISHKNVLLMVMHLGANGTPGRDETFSQEYFFGDALEPGAVEVYDEPATSFGQAVNGVPLIDDGHDQHAVARVRVEFVQFSDGSAWGDAGSAENVLKMRSETLAELDMLEHIYEQAGEEAFLEEFAGADDYLPTISQLKHSCKDKAKTSNCAHDAVQRTIDAAKNHQTEMDSGIAGQGPRHARPSKGGLLYFICTSSPADVVARVRGAGCCGARQLSNIET